MSESLTDADVTSPIRVMKVLALFGVGGTEGQVLNLVKSMDRSRFEIQFACMRRWGSLLEDVAEMKVPVSEFHVTSLYKPHTIRRMFELANFMRDQRIQVVHTYNFYANVFAIPAARLAGVPFVVASIRDQGVYLTSKQKLVQRQVCRFADRILVNAFSIRNWLIDQGYAADRIRLIRNGIKMEKYDGPTSTALREELGIAEGAPLVVMLSRLNPQKGVDDFLKAAQLVLKSKPDARFVLIGEKLTSRNGEFMRDDDYLRQLEALVRELGIEQRVFFAGHRSDVPQILSDVSVSVLPSLSEGTSNSLLESMAAGVPVVATRVGGTPELLDYGKCGCLVPVKDPVRLAEAIGGLLNDPLRARRLGEAGKARAADCFSLEKMVRDTEAFYQHELSSRISSL